MITLATSTDPPGYRGQVHLNLLPELRRLELIFVSDISPLRSLTTLGRVLHHLPRNTVEELIIHAEWTIYNFGDLGAFSGNTDSTRFFLTLKDEALFYDTISSLFDIDAAIMGPNFPSLTKVSLNLLAKYFWQLGYEVLEPEIRLINATIRKGLSSTSNSSKIQLNVTVDAKIAED